MRKISALIFWLLFAVGSVIAQDSQQAAITGIITDQSQASIQKAEVTVTNQKTGLSRKAATDTDGIFTILALQPGVYNVKVTSPGFKAAEAAGIALNIGATVRLNLTLEPGQVSETVTVQADLGLQTETAEVSNLISGMQVSEVALNGRNFTQFLTLGAGVSSSQTGRQMSLGQEGNPLMAVHGGRISMNKFTYDGSLAMDTGGNRGLNLFPPMEAIAEVKAQKSNYSADSGGFGYSVVNVVTKSGGQKFHGDVYEYFRNDRWFNTAAFRAVTQTGRIGTSPVNVVRGPGVNNFDLSLFKNIRFSESARFQFGIEAYNIFNHPQFDAVNGNINSATFGRMTSARDPCIMQIIFRPRERSERVEESCE
jgi:hypothetical protein